MFGQNLTCALKKNNQTTQPNKQQNQSNNQPDFIVKNQPNEIFTTQHPSRIN
jgi:hypothetical protein